MSNENTEKKIVIEKSVFEALKDLRYGSVEITVHDSRIVQIERKEKVRFDQTAGK